MTMFSRRCLFIILIFGLLSSCGDKSTNSTNEFIISGTIQNNTSGSIPANARLLVVWSVDSGSSDTSYIFGEGTINPSMGTFQIDLETPPAEVLSGSLGIGFLIVTTNTTVGTGDAIDNIPNTELIGAAGMYGIIYVADQTAQVLSWAADFPIGYSVGIGVTVPGTFDKFAPTEADSPILIIDDFANISFVNWS